MEWVLLFFNTEETHPCHWDSRECYACHRQHMIEGDIPSFLTPGAKSFPLLYTGYIQTTIHIPHPLIIREPKYLAHGNNSVSF